MPRLTLLLPPLTTLLLRADSSTAVAETGWQVIGYHVAKGDAEVSRLCVLLCLNLAPSDTTGLAC